MINLVNHSVDFDTVKLDGGVVITTSMGTHSLATNIEGLHSILLDGNDTDLSDEVIELLENISPKATLIIDQDTDSTEGLTTVGQYFAGMLSGSAVFADPGLKDSLLSTYNKQEEEKRKLVEASELRRAEQIEQEKKKTISLEGQTLEEVVMDLMGDIPNHESISEAADWFSKNVNIINTNKDWYLWNGVYWELIDHVHPDLVIAEVYRKQGGGDNKVAKAINAKVPDHNALRKQITEFTSRDSKYWEGGRDYIAFPDATVLSTNTLEEVKPGPHLAINRVMEYSPAPKGSEPEGLLEALRERYKFDQNHIDYIQLLCGAALLGRSTKNWSIWIGGSNTGKTALMIALMKCYGGYGATIPSTALTTGSAAKFSRHFLRGVRFAALDEMPTKTDDEFIKALVGGSAQIFTERKGKDIEKWESEATLVTATNKMPRFDTKDEAIVERADPIEFKHSMKNLEVRKKNWSEFICETEGPEIVRWILDGAEKYLEKFSEESKIPSPADNKERLKDLYAEQSISVAWLLEALSPDYNEDGAFLMDISGEDVNREFWALATQGQEAYQEFCKWYQNQVYLRHTTEKRPKSTVWRADICRYMKAPQSFIDQRQFGGNRLYNLALVTNKSVVLSNGDVPPGL